VPAHAPRLQGQKIWKKAGIQIRNDKENEAALLELQSDGNGARKKRKVWAAKENIGHASWKSVSGSELLTQDQNNAEITGCDDAASEQGTGTEDALRFIPRKRTNTDHVITPRIPLRQTYLNSQAQTVEVGSGVTLREKPPRRNKPIRRRSRQSTGVRVARTSLFSAGNGAVPSLAADIDINLHTDVMQQRSETTREMIFNTDSLTMGNELARHDTEPRQSLAGQRFPESDEMDVDSWEPAVVKDTDIPKRRKRSSILRGPRRSTRSSISLQGVTEEPSVQGNPANDKMEFHLPTSHDLQDDLGQEIISGESTTRSTHNACTNTSMEESQKPIQLSANYEALDKESSMEDSFRQSLPTVGLQPEIQSVRVVDRVHQTKNTLQAAGSSPEQPERAFAEDQSRPEHSTAEVSTASQIIFEANLSLKINPQVAEHKPAIDSPSDEKYPVDPLPVSHLVDAYVEASFSQTSDEVPGAVADLEPKTQIPAEDTSNLETITFVEDELPESPAVDQSVSEPAQALPESAPFLSYEDDDADMLRKFLTRVKASKAAKAENITPQRKRSLPHSPLRLPLGELDANNSPSPLSLKPKDVVEASDPSPLPKRRKRHESATDADDEGKSKAIRRSGRTKLPVKTAAPGAPSLIPVRRLGKDGDTTVTLRGNEEKELAALTRVNTRKNKGALNPAEVLLLKAAEKTDPVLKQRLLKEMFEEKKKKGKNSEKAKSVAWAEELTQFQSEKKDDTAKDKVTMGSSSEKKKSAVRVGAAVRNKMSLGQPVNGTPGTKRKMRERT
jgi:hypothetical protein